MLLIIRAQLGEVAYTHALGQLGEDKLLALLAMRVGRIAHDQSASESLGGLPYDTDSFGIAPWPATPEMPFRKFPVAAPASVPQRKIPVAASVVVGVLLGALLGTLALVIAAVANAAGNVPYARTLGVWLDSAMLVPLAAVVLPRMKPFGRYWPELRQIIVLQFLLGLVGGAFAAGRWLSNHEAEIQILSFGRPGAVGVAAIGLAILGMGAAIITSETARGAFVAIVFIELAAAAICDPVLFGLTSERSYSVVVALALAGGIAGAATHPAAMQICGPPDDHPSYVGALMWPVWTIRVSASAMGWCDAEGWWGLLATIVGLVLLFGWLGAWALLVLTGAYGLGLLTYTRPLRWLVSWERT